MQIPEYFNELSIRMSEALVDCGARKDTVMERRDTYLCRESCEFLARVLRGTRFECFHFGSQSEGTTTPGLQSDIDILYSSYNVNIMTDLGDWKAGMCNLLMLYDDFTPPQQYLLQVFRVGIPEPETSLCDDMLVRKDSGVVLFSAERWKQDVEHSLKNFGQATKQGPSVSARPNWDVVHAFHVCKPLPEIQHWIDRCSGRHWPSVQLLEAARAAPCFLVPAGHPDSNYKREEWRLSPNLIERMLMFSFNMTQIKCYIVLKLINKSLFANIVGDSITSFHCKTLMFYAIERTHPSLWFEHNLMFLLWHCLLILRKWLQVRRLPHYIIEGVNLFEGKISIVQQRRLLVYIDSMIRSNLHDVFHIGIENIGCRLQACGMRRIVQAGELRRDCLLSSISVLLEYERLERFLKQLRISLDQMLSSNRSFVKHMAVLLCIALECSDANVRLKYVSCEFFQHVYGLHNSIQSSNCLRLRQLLDSELLSRMQYSFNTDVASSRLKLASTLYCSGHLHAAARVFEDVERRYHSKVKAVCGCRHVDRDLELFASLISGIGYTGFSEPPFAFCVKLFRHELHCAPCILLFEMNRNITEEESTQRSNVEKQWMGSA
ncbi:hypothetical protein DPMN_056469 [Dreissena polymorpha]|uniref:Mab-21-like HhH/H2TH-like domain-containing protein n=1 Tax=Dreissena polymorpha TaxID=45954 RepID=A0A9D4HTM6_DREPO|nr:hypothetical protein DPMN_056469 [Dreissena polymorpha]